MHSQFSPRSIFSSLILLFVLFATGCTKIQRHGDMSCRQPWSLWGMAMTECSIKNVPLRSGKSRSFTVLTNTIIPNALQVSLQGFRPGFHAWRYYLEKAEAVTLQIDFTTLDGAALISKQVHLADARRELGPPVRTHAGIRDYANFELLNSREHSGLRSDLTNQPGYKIRIEILKEGDGGKREGKLLYDYWLHMPGRYTNSSAVSSGATLAGTKAVVILQ